MVCRYAIARFFGLVKTHAACLIAVGAISLPAVCGCQSKSKSYEIERWGSMHEALREGRTGGRVGLARFDGARDTIAVGALEGLSGEILVIEGDVWLSRVDDNGAAMTTRGASTDDHATMLTAGRVARWRAIPIESDVLPTGVEEFLVDSARAAGFDPQCPIPFKVVGKLLDLELHVVAGACPMAASHGRTESAMRPPFRKSWERANAKLVGFLAEGLEGTLTHHGSRMHAHALVEVDEPVMGHVDRVGIASGGILYLPGR